MKNVKNLFSKLFLSVVFIVLTCACFLTGCNNFAYTFKFVENTIIKNVNESFNVFDLTYTTNLPEELNFKNYKRANVFVENINIVTFDNCIITPIGEGRTKIEVVINFENQVITASFNLVVNAFLEEGETPQNPETPKEDEGITKEKTPMENPTDGEDGDLKGKLVPNKEYNLFVDGYTFLFEVCKNNSGVVIYTIKLMYYESAVNSYNVIVLNNSNSEITNVLPGVKQILCYNTNPLEIQISSANVLLGNVILECE